MSMRSDCIKRLRGERTELIPWFADLEWFRGGLSHTGRLRPEHEGLEGHVRFFEDYKVGWYLYAPFTCNTDFVGDVTFEQKYENDCIYTAYHTKYGDITSIQKYQHNTLSYAYEKHMIESIEDMKIMAHIHEQSRYSPNYEAFNEREAMYGENGLAFTSVPEAVAPLQSMIANWAGIEKTIELFADETEDFEECLTVIQQAHMPMFDVIAGSDALVVEFGENLASDLVGSLFAKYDAPHYREVNEILHKAGKITSIHIDGALNPCLGMLHDAGFDIAEAVTPAPIGDIALEDLRKVAGDDIILWGCIPGALFSPVYSDEQFCNHIKKILDLNDPKMVLGVGDQVPPDAVEWRVREVSRLIGRG